MKSRSRSPAQKGLAGKRGAARLAAVQALYQLEMNTLDPADAGGANAGADDVEALILEFLTHRPGAILDGENIEFAETDQGLFSDIVRGVVRRQAEIDKILHANLTKSWPLHRLEKILRTVMRCGVYELLLRADVPYKVIINEYVELAGAFFSGGEPAMVNAVLDGAATSLRGTEKNQAG